MEERVDTRKLRKAASLLGDHVDCALAPTALYFSTEPPAENVTPEPGRWTCLFAVMGPVQDHRPAVFSAAAPGCIGAAYYLGFNSLPPGGPAVYLSSKERLKKDAGLAAAFYREVRPVAASGDNLVFCRLDGVPDDAEVEVVNLWVGVESLSSLHTLANYDRAANENVIMPFSSGCQSIWTLPYKEKESDEPRAVAGSLDPTVRRFLPTGTVSFSVPAARFLEMCSNIRDSFLGK